MVRLVGSTDDYPLRGETVDMSPGGLAMQVGEPVSPGTAVEAVIARPSEREMLVIRGHVVHSRRILTGMYEIGVSIVGRDPRR